MLLVIEVGNTNTKIGVYEGPRLLGSWRLTSRREQTADEYGLFIETLLRTRGFAPSSITGVAISNVVPPVQQTLEWMCEQYFGVAPFTVEPGVNTPIPLEVDEPRQVGADRVVKAVAAVTLWGPPLIVIDFGTATTFDCINTRGAFIGGAIAPGISTASDALLNRAARLFRVELVRPKDAIGRDTVSNIQSGIVYGWAGLVDGIVERMKAEMDGTPRVIATGGQAGLIANVARSIQDVHEHLAFEGLRLLWERAHPS
ncbi:MAG: type III pantothenate kinase [Candidatus Rokuibacteriota bacterium]|nr:MAG: type III pantothenate kinase [Candidatus Rokubacteria bacterium]